MKSRFRLFPAFLLEMSDAFVFRLKKGSYMIMFVSRKKKILPCVLKLIKNLWTSHAFMVSLSDLVIIESLLCGLLLWGQEADELA